MELGEIQRPDMKQPSAVKPTISFSHLFPPIIMMSLGKFLIIKLVGFLIKKILGLKESALLLGRLLSVTQ